MKADEHASTLYGQRVVCTCGDFNCASLDATDEPRRTEPDAAMSPLYDEDDVSPFMDENGLVHIAGQWPAHGGI